MGQSDFVRARRPEHKQQRREAILDAARRLAVQSRVSAVTLSGVAAEVGMAPSNLMRYFTTREEIYLVLTSECWEEWAAAVAGRLREAQGQRGLVDTLAETLAERPLFCDLLSLTAISLEHNASVATLLDFKRLVHRTGAELGERAASAHPGLSAAEAGELVQASAALAGMLHPVANPPETAREVYRQNPDLAAACPEFLPTLRRALAAMAAGLPTLR